MFDRSLEYPFARTRFYLEDIFNLKMLKKIASHQKYILTSCPGKMKLVQKYCMTSKLDVLIFESVFHNFSFPNIRLQVVKNAFFK